MPSISLVMPAHNEAENIEPVVTEAVPALAAVSNDFEIIVVDDGSKDDTAGVTRRLMETEPHLRLVQHPVNKGFGAAVLTGFTSATKDWILYADADRQFVLAELANLTPYTDKADLIAGYRAPRRDPFLRVLYGKGWSMLCTLRAKRAGYRFVELPVTHRPRVAGSQSGARLSVITRAFRELFRLRLQLWRGE
jgi:glycosyltransferase involved in cell wall biosynthesis